MGEEEGVRPRNESAASAIRRLSYPRLWNLCVVKTEQTNLMLLGFLFVYLGCSAGVKPFFPKSLYAISILEGSDRVNRHDRYFMFGRYSGHWAHAHSKENFDQINKATKT
jgi:hypothetical protein